MGGRFYIHTTTCVDGQLSMDLRIKVGACSSTFTHAGADNISA